MKVLEVLNTLRLDHGGPTYSVSHLARALQSLGSDVELHILGESSLASDFPVRVKSYAQSRLAMWRGLEQRVPSTQILHSHGLWKFPNFVSARVTAKSGCRHVISPRGMLARESLSEKQFRKQIALLAFQKNAIENASFMHATSEMEMQDLRSLGFRVPIAVIPNGVDTPATGRALLETLPRRIIYMGRIAPLKRIDQLIQAWTLIASERPNWSLHIIGEGDADYRRKLEAMHAPRTTFEGGIYGNARDEWYRRAELLVLPSYAENFGMVVAESLAHGTTVIASKGTPWQSLNEKRCGWWTECDAKALSETLRHVTSLPSTELHARGVIGRTWMKESFGWPRVGEQMTEAYRWALGERAKPNWVFG